MTKTANIKIKRIYEDPAKDDGYRILVDRLWPRGIRKNDAMLDEWNKTIAPSPQLRKWFAHRAERFEEFANRYRTELLDKTQDLKRIANIAQKQHVTLLYAAKYPEISHAKVLLDELLKPDQLDNELNKKK